MEPPPEIRRGQLLRYYEKTWRARLELDPELEQVHTLVKKILSGKPFIATKAWETPNANGKSLLDESEARLISGSTNRREGRWRAKFTSKAARHELRGDNMNATPRGRG